VSAENTKERLIIFTRYPARIDKDTIDTGRAQAATLHRQMTEHTLSKVRELHSPTSVEVRFTGGNPCSNARLAGV